MTRWMLCLAFLCWSCAHAPVGSPPAAMSRTVLLQTLNGASTSLSAFEGKNVLVDFWASWCEPCRVSMPFYAQLHQELSARGFTVVGVTLDEDVSAAQGFVQELGLPFPILRDEKGELAEAMAVKGLPTMFLLDGSGQVRYRHQGFNPTDPEKVRREVLQLLEGAQAPAR
jgi:peroxiredoxin